MSNSLSQLTTTQLATASSNDTGNALPSQCYAIADEAGYIFQSVGREFSLLCSVDGEFATAASQLESCIVSQGSTINYCSAAQSISQTAAIVGSAVDYCISAAPANASAFTAWAIFSSQCFNQQAASIDASLCSVASLSGYSRAGCGTTTTSSGSSTSSASSATASSSTTIAAATAANNNGTLSETSSGSHGLKSGAIAGIAVGAVAAVLLLIAGIGWFMFRRRQQNKARLAAGDGHDQAAEKAQLHSDDIKPDRKELTGTIPQRKSRIVGTLTELPANDGRLASKGHAEMQANEVVGNELEGASGHERESGVDGSDSTTAGNTSGLSDGNMK